MSAKNSGLQMASAMEAENAIIGNLLLGDQDFVLDAVYLLRPDHFYNRSNAIIFKTIIEMVKDGKPVDLITVTDRLRSNERLEEIGGAFGLSKLTAEFPSVSQFAHYYEVLKDKWRLRKLQELGAELTTRGQGSTTAGDLMKRVETELFTLFHDESAGDDQLLNGCNQFLEQISLREKDPSKKPGIQTGLRKFNELFGALMPAHYYAIGGRPGAGKSAMAEQFALDAALAGNPTLYVSAEMSKDRFIARLAAKLARVNLSFFLRGGARKEERDKLREATNQVAKLPITLITPNELTGIGLRSLVRRYERKSGIKMFVLDYLQLITVTPGVERWQAIGEASTQIRRSVNETGVTGLILVQLNREADRESRPRMSHIREAGMIEQDADAVMLLSVDPDGENPATGDKLVRVNVDKNRDGATAELELIFEGKFLTFKDS